ncbi:hypothetical protein JCM11641_005813 [Rhodosporidiobolus odoratus]
MAFRAPRLRYDLLHTLARHVSSRTKVAVGPNCTVGKGARLQRCVLLDGSRVKDHVFVQSSIIGWSSSVGKWVRHPFEIATFSVLMNPIKIHPSKVQIIALKLDGDRKNIIARKGGKKEDVEMKDQ